MGCQVSDCTDNNEFLLTQPLPSLDATLISSCTTLSDKSTKPSINTFVRNRKLLASQPLEFPTVASTVRMFMKEKRNYGDLEVAMKLWRKLVYVPLQDTALLPEDLHTTLSYESTGERFTITHEVDGIRVFHMVPHFCRVLADLQLATSTSVPTPEEYERVETFLMSLSPLTVSVFVSLGERIEAGIGVVKPMEQRELREFWGMVEDSDGVEEWCGATQPIPVSFMFTMGSQEATVSLYLFDGEKEVNFTKALSIFEYFGAPLPENIAEFLKMASGEELHCILHLSPRGISRFGVQVTGLELPRIVELCGLLDSPFEEKKSWQFGRAGNEGPAVRLELTPEGFTLTQLISIC